jgi:hypothetical protein
MSLIPLVEKSPVAGSCEHGSELLDSIISFPQKLSDCQLLKKDYAPVIWSFLYFINCTYCMACINLTRSFIDTERRRKNVQPFVQL